MKYFKILLFLLFSIFLLFPSLALAQSQRNPCYYTAANPGPGGGCVPVSTVNPLPIFTVPGGAAGQFTASAPSGALTLTTGGTSQVLFAAGEVIHGCVIQNPSTATEKIHINFFTSAVNTDGGTSEELAVGSTVGCGVGWTGAISWNAATTSHAINAWKF